MIGASILAGFRSAQARIARLRKDQQRRRRFRQDLLSDASGNALALAAGASVILLLAVGGGVDMSRSYLTKTNLQSACDAGVLAGRRALSKSGVYASAEQAKANMMFNANMTPGQTQASHVTFTTEAHADGSVTGEATAKMPFVIMSAFGFASTDLAVECSAELQMASADVMFVLDTTGSMGGTKIAGLRDAVREFHKTVSEAVINKDETVIRYGFVPYSMTVNASGLVASGAMRAAWFADAADYRTKVAKFRTKDYVAVNSATTTTNEVSQSYSSSDSCKNWANASSTSSGTKPDVTSVVSYQYVSWVSSSRTCTRKRTKVDTTWRTVWKFSGWSNVKASVPTKGLVGGGSLSIISSTPSTGTNFAYVSEWGDYDMRTLAKMVDAGTAARMPASAVSPWGGCIEERQTVVDYAMDPVPAGALDLNLNDAPSDDDDATKWKPYWGGDTGILRNASGGTLAEYCPSPMRQFEKVDTRNSQLPTELNAYLNALTPVGNTYHDIGMIWGARLASTRGMFAANVLEGDRKSVSRHIIFMTDGQMDPITTGYNAYGIEALDNRVAPSGATSGSSGTVAKYHNNRFLAACQRAKEEGYTIWVIGFTTTISNDMKRCASADRHYFASDTSELKNAFRYIAGQVADLRLKR